MTQCPIGCWQTPSDQAKNCLWAYKLILNIIMCTTLMQGRTSYNFTPFEAIGAVSVYCTQKGRNWEVKQWKQDQHMPTAKTATNKGPYRNRSSKRLRTDLSPQQWNQGKGK